MPTDRRTYKAQWHQANKARTAEQDRARYLKNKEKRIWQVTANRYNITAERARELIAAGCGICGAKISSDGRKLCIDHDHSCCPGKTSCGKCVRGALCDLCNRGLGHFREDPGLTQKAVDYLKKWSR